ncbi:MAG TPA: hypothetical protein PLL30_17585 [Candidatus Krumholzibacteria bacterium]|nr:hypothetical protein [Candidatus Krumholzibacteria bacterium]HPD73590.1 hypothetical protein [Candidatus Krumholzibacteria bacterium]HRY42274.1 hypothetical protein [Candidatus Krumholzibacteria bacterium]
MISPSRVAVQGIGYGARLVALQGFGLLVDVPPVELPTTTGGGGKSRRRVEFPRLDVYRENENLLLLVTAILQSECLE